MVQGGVCCVAAQVMLALMKDGTIAIQAALAQALVQWPFLHDTSLLAAVMAVFMPPHAPGAGADAAASAAVAAAADALDITLLLPWLYFNLLMTDSQLYVPVLDKVGLMTLQHICLLPDWRSQTLPVLHVPARVEGVLHVTRTPSLIEVKANHKP